MRSRNALGIFTSTVQVILPYKFALTHFAQVGAAEMVATEIHKSRWTGERIARLGFLLGLGWDAKRIAEDPIIASTPNNVHRQAQRVGLAFRAAVAAMSL